MVLSAVLAPAPDASAEQQPAAITHRYDPVAGAEPSPEARKLAERLGATGEVLELYSKGEDRPLVRVEAAILPDGSRQILDWRSLGATPLLRRDISAAEDLRLVEALQTHLPENSSILAFPGISHRLQALISATFPLADAVEPLVIPPPWQRRAADAAALEIAFWGTPAAKGQPDNALDALIDALLAEDVNGAARIRVLAGMGEAYLLLHLGDAFQLGQLRPGRMEIVRRDFAASGFSHDLAREARRWGQSNGHAAWAVDRAQDGSLRGHYLTDAAETATLAAQLLPFNTSRLDSVAGLRLVWQWEGYWLYRVSPVAETPASY